MDEWKYEWKYDPARLRHLERNLGWRWRLCNRLSLFQLAMREAPRQVKEFWLWMLELPWQVQADEKLRRNS